MAAARKPGRPSLIQVAELSGVSVKTASRALSGEPRVAEVTRSRVRSVADQLGYRPNGVARELRRGAATSTLVGLLIGDLANPFYARLAGGLERELRSHGLQLVIASTDEDPRRERRLADVLLERRVRALVIASTAAEHAHFADEQRHGIPFVFVDRPAVNLAADSVLFDNRDGARQVGRHLVGLGHRRIGVVGDLSRLSTHRDRVTGFARAMREAGRPDWAEYLIENAHDVPAAERVIRDLLRRVPAPTALFTMNNLITHGALRALRGHPAPPALVGFDDIDLGEVLGISVVTHDPVDMGRRAAELLLGRLDGEAGPPRRVVLPTRLLPRGSGERPPGRADAR
ncbi:LacI family DNA-binding transcriptional regulator [Micromonospora sp. WMMD1076]|uniref:LacI family DNA-binding transcriptional regulator n=1 Tax=Micromonospora sp. WMMD1076 TaxID=3016103 RepID=UPI002499B091|nr:LacI family DNA-binding transcriptional regulator [Micromonospora sp. WMMD1076]WFF04594.1 LacI family DNA-binding transcriptional regulator [Micromonospora sp. WMMD1076]